MEPPKGKNWVFKETLGKKRKFLNWKEGPRKVYPKRPFLEKGSFGNPW